MPLQERMVTKGAVNYSKVALALSCLRDLNQEEMEKVFEWIEKHPEEFSTKEK